MRANYSTKKTAKAKAAKPARQPRAATAPAPLVPEFKPRIEFKPTVVPVGNGKFEISAGKPVIVPEEIGTRDFARLVRLSRDYVARLCDLGVIQARRKSPRMRSSWLIARAELDRFLTADPHEQNGGGK